MLFFQDQEQSQDLPSHLSYSTAFLKEKQI